MKFAAYQKFIAAGVSLIAMTSCVAFAQEPSQPSAASADTADSGIADIIVTAERRSARLQDTPIAISAIGGSELQSEHITNFEALAANIPNVQFSKALGMARVFIRGIGLDSQSGGEDPRVAIYTDGVYNARSQAAFNSYYDIERVEVLSGPQGTLYGRNATAGAINIMTRDPTKVFEGYGTVTFGNYHLVQTEGALSGPLSDTISARVAFNTSDHSGYGKNLMTGAEANVEHRQAFRGKLLIEPSNDARIMLIGDYSHNVGGGGSFLGNTPGNLNYGQEQGYTVATGFDAVGNDPGVRLTTYGGSATVDLGLGGAKLTSITGLRHVKSALKGNADASTANFLPLYLDEKSNVFTQELRLAHTIGPVDFLLGAYYFHEKNSAVNTSNVSSGLVPALIMATTTGNCCIGIPQQTGPFVLLNGAYFGGRQKIDAYALFTQETVHFTDQLGLDLGLRYSYEKRHIDQFFQLDLARPVGSVPLLDPTTGPVGAQLAIQSASWDSFDPKVTLHYKITPDVMAYATYSKGFKSGGFNFSQIQPPFAPEKLVNYEVGIKADLFDRRVRVNLAGFHYDYTNLQVNTVVLTSLLTTNAGRAKIDGFEAQVWTKPVDNMQLNFNLSYLDSRYTRFTTVDNGRPGLGTLNLAGNQLQYAPKWKIGGDFSYTIETAIGAFTPRADVTWTDDVYFTQFNLPYVAQKAYWLGNLFLDWDAGNGWNATAFVRNVGDKRYAIAGTTSTLIVGGHVTGTLGEPRTYGISLTKQF